MSREAFVSDNVGESLLECNDAVLHECEGAEPEYSDSWACEGSPVSVKVHFKSLVEDTVSATNSVTLNALSEITRLFGLILELSARLAPVRLVEAEELLIRASCCH